MEQAFWQSRWASGQIGFHQPQVNGYLARHWSALALSAGDTVLVPLCGKSLDMTWLRAQGHPVLGVELVEAAAEAFFAEQALAAERFERLGVVGYRAEGIEILCGDFFDMPAALFADCAAFYDRAALIALPPAMRERYAARLDAVLPARCSGLLVTLDYLQSQRAGPPFAVSDDEVRTRFPHWQSERLQREDVLAAEPHFAAKGVTALHESVWRLRRA